MFLNQVTLQIMQYILFYPIYHLEYQPNFLNSYYLIVFDQSLTSLVITFYLSLILNSLSHLTSLNHSHYSYLYSFFAIHDQTILDSYLSSLIKYLKPSKSHEYLAFSLVLILYHPTKPLYSLYYLLALILKIIFFPKNVYQDVCLH